MSTPQQSYSVEYLEQYTFKQTRFYNILYPKYLSGVPFGSPHARRSNYMHMHTRKKILQPHHHQRPTSTQPSKHLI
jgi:hypothetical protein